MYVVHVKLCVFVGGGKIVEQYLATSSQTLRVYTVIGMGFILGYGKSNRALLREQTGAASELVTVFKTTMEAKSQIFSPCLLASVTLAIASVEGNRSFPSDSHM